MTIEARLFEEQDLIKIKELLVLYEDLGYPTITEDLVNRLKRYTVMKIIICYF